jgi:hypothetical protein
MSYDAAVKGYLPISKDNLEESWENLLAMCEQTGQATIVGLSRRGQFIKLRQWLHGWRKSYDENGKFTNLKIRDPDKYGQMIVELTEPIDLEELNL